MQTTPDIEIRECETLDELAACVSLQREVFALPEIEISPLRHFVVTRNAGGWALGAFAGEILAGFVLSVPAILRGEKAFYSNMTAVKKEFQSHGVGAKLKWSQRKRALDENVKYLKWTFQPVQTRNAYFNLEKLGASVREYKPNFYGTDYSTVPGQIEKVGLDSDRLFAEWQLESEKVKCLASGEIYRESRNVEKEIAIPNDWNKIVEADPQKAIAEQNRIRKEFEAAFAQGLICRGFQRGDSPKYLLYKD